MAIGLVLALCVVGVLVTGAGTASVQNTIVVDPGGGGDYETIQNAVDNATDGDTIEVRPAVYEEEVNVPGKDITITAPDGATLDGSNSCCDAFDLFGNDEVTITGFLIENWNRGIYADRNDGNWTATDNEFRNNGDAIHADSSTGFWTATENVIYNQDNANDVRGTGLNSDATGNYWGQPEGPDDSQCFNADCGYFLSSPNGSANVPPDRPNPVPVATDGSEPYATINDALVVARDDNTVDTVTVRPGTYRNEVTVPGRKITITAPNGATLNGSNSCCDAFDLFGNDEVTITGFLIENWNRGIYADRNDGNWTATDNEFRNNGDAIHADSSTGFWTATENVIYNQDNANRVRGTGLNSDATGNYWGQSEGPDDSQCFNADCGYFLSSPNGSANVPPDRPNPVPVATDGSEPYATINDALVVARDDDTVDTVTVRPGTYRNEVTVPGREITITAPSGATLNGSNSCCEGFDLRRNGDIDISGFVIENWNRGIYADRNDGNWTATNNEFRNNGDAIDADSSYGYWSANQNIIRNDDNQNEVRGVDPSTSDATRNYWDQPNGSVADQCIDADCSDPLDSPPPILGGATLEVSALVPADATIAAGASIDVSASIQNPSNVTQTETVELAVGGVTETTQLTLNGSQSETVTFQNVDLSPLARTDYTLTVSAGGDEVRGTLRVVGEDALAIDQGRAAIDPGTEISFDAAFDGRCPVGQATFEWSFGDGTTTEADCGESVSHVFSGNGAYTVEVTVTNHSTASGWTATSEVLVDDSLNFVSNPSSPEPGESVTFEATGSGTIQWEFGDGSTAVGQRVTHRYGNPGTYTVTASNGSGGTVTRTVEVERDPPEIVGIDGLDSPVLTAAQSERTIQITVLANDTSSGSSTDTVELTFRGETVEASRIDSRQENGLVRETWEYDLNVTGIESARGVTVTVTDDKGDVAVQSGTLAVQSLPDWVDTLRTFFDPREEGGVSSYELRANFFDQSVKIDDATPPQYDTHLLLQGNASAALIIDNQGLEAQGEIKGSAGVAGTIASLGGRVVLVPTYPEYGIETLNITGTAEIERELFEKEVGVSSISSSLPNVCSIGAEASISGNANVRVVFVDGFSPANLDTVALQAGPQLAASGGGSCGPFSLTLSGEASVDAGVGFEGEIPPAFRGAGIRFELVFALTGSADAGVVEGSVSGDIVGLEINHTTGEYSFIDPVSTGSGPGSIEWTRQEAGAPTPLNEEPAIDAASLVGSNALAATDTSTQRVTERPFDDTQPALVTTDSGRTLLWSSEPNATGASAPRDLRVATPSGQGWSDPVEVTDDGAADVDPDLAVDGSRSVAAWTRIPDAGNVTGIDDLFDAHEIAVATTTDATDPAAWSSVTTLTDANGTDREPAITSLGSDQWFVAWDRNTAANFTDLDAETVEYALLSTGTGTPTVTARGSIRDARAPAVGVDGGTPLLAVHRPNSSIRDGTVLQGTVDPQNGTFTEVDTHQVTNFTDLAAAGETIVWLDGTGGAQNATQATPAGNTSAVPIAANATRIGDLSLAAGENRTILTYSAATPRSGIERDLLVQTRRDGDWGTARQLARGNAAENGTVLRHAAPAVGDTPTAAYAVSERTAETSEDLFVTQLPDAPPYDLDATIDGPEDPQIGDTVTVRATVTNEGTVDATDQIDLRVTDGESTLVTTAIGPLAAGETTTVTLTPSLPATGDIVVALGDATPATDDGLFGQTATKRVATAGLAVANVSVSRDSETSAEAAITVRNEGVADSQPVPLSLRDGETVLGTAAVGPIGGGDAATVTVTFDPRSLDRTTGETVVLDPDRTVASEEFVQPAASVLAGRPTVAIEEVVSYLGSVPISASVLLSNGGPIGSTVTVRAVEPGGPDDPRSVPERTVGTTTVDLPPGINGSTQFVEATVPIGALGQGDQVRFVVETDRPNADVSATTLRETVGPVLGSEGPAPIDGGRLPRDLNGDDRYEDTDGDGTVTLADPRVLYENRNEVPSAAVPFFDFDGDGGEQVDEADVQALVDGELPDDIYNAAYGVDTVNLLNGIDRWRNGALDIDDLLSLIDTWRDGSRIYQGD